MKLLQPSLLQSLDLKCLPGALHHPDTHLNTFLTLQHDINNPRRHLRNYSVTLTEVWCSGTRRRLMWRWARSCDWRAGKEAHGGPGSPPDVAQSLLAKSHAPQLNRRCREDREMLWCNLICLFVISWVVFLPESMDTWKHFQINLFSHYSASFLVFLGHVSWSCW